MVFYAEPVMESRKGVVVVHHSLQVVKNKDSQVSGSVADAKERLPHSRLRHEILRI